jgi:hypothetical protein
VSPLRYLLRGEGKVEEQGTRLRYHINFYFFIQTDMIFVIYLQKIPALAQGFFF